MALAQSLTAIIIFWAIVGGLGASLLLPAMQSLIHGKFEGPPQRKVYAMVGAAAAIAAAVGPLLGGFITTYLSWRVAFLLEAVVIAIVLSGIKLIRDVPYTGPRRVDPVGAVLSVLGMGGVVLGILVAVGDDVDQRAEERQHDQKEAPAGLGTRPASLRQMMLTASLHDARVAAVRR
jgi:MFS family permease